MITEKVPVKDILSNILALLSLLILVKLPCIVPLLKLPPSNYKTQFSGIFILASFKS
ncbi:MAG: hypothetical protein ACLT69_10320 [Intestinibacter bartlettii]|uniref:hypothetical protein n=1 Tax=Romboutsia timonensis TaxID=1776391 RepID=UPI00248C6044|nr:hypothetical protein [Romboutsia timonensis]